MIRYAPLEARQNIYQDGRRPYQAGRSLTWCPYIEGDLREAWKSGWFDARREARLAAPDVTVGSGRYRLTHDHDS